MTDLKQTGSGNEYEGGRGPEGTEPSKNLKKICLCLNHISVNIQCKNFCPKQLTGRRATTNEKQDADPSDGWSAHGRTTRS